MSINWASTDRGAKVIDVSSEVVGCEAKHVLDASPETKWLTGERYRDESASHWICLSLTNTPPDLAIRTVGWHCASSYSSNPHTVFLHVSSDGINFKAWDRFVCPRQVKGASLFICSAPISIEIYPYMCFEVTKTFGDHQKEDWENIAGSGSGANNGGRGSLPTSTSGRIAASPPHGTVASASAPTSIPFAAMGTYMNRIFCYSDEIPTSPMASLHRRRATANGSATRRPLAASPLPLSPMAVSLSNHSSFYSPDVGLSNRNVDRVGRLVSASASTGAGAGITTDTDTRAEMGPGTVTATERVSGCDFSIEWPSFVLRSQGSAHTSIRTSASTNRTTAAGGLSANGTVCNGDDNGDDGGVDDDIGEHDDDSLDCPPSEPSSTSRGYSGTVSGSVGGLVDGGSDGDGCGSVDAGAWSGTTGTLVDSTARLDAGYEDSVSALHSALGFCLDEGNDMDDADGVCDDVDVDEVCGSGSGSDEGVLSVPVSVPVAVHAPLSGSAPAVSGGTVNHILYSDTDEQEDGEEGGTVVGGEGNDVLLLRERVRTLECQLAALLARLPVDSAVGSGVGTGSGVDQQGTHRLHSAPPSVPALTSAPLAVPASDAISPPIPVDQSTSTTLAPATPSASAPASVLATVSASASATAYTRPLAPVTDHSDDIVALATLLHRKLRLRLLKQVQLNLLLSTPTHIVHHTPSE